MNKTDKNHMAFLARLKEVSKEAYNKGYQPKNKRSYRPAYSAYNGNLYWWEMGASDFDKGTPNRFDAELKGVTNYIKDNHDLENCKYSA